MDWYLECSDCGATAEAAGLPTVCTVCGRPYLVRYRDREHSREERHAVFHGNGMWRYRSFLPLAPGEDPVTLGEGDTPLLPAPRLAERLGLGDIWIKDEGCNPTGSFKARGLSAAITRAVAAGAKQFVIPTAGNAGVASSAYSARAGAKVRVYAPRSTPATILAQISAYGADLVLLDGHIGDCGKASRQFATEADAVDLSTLREPYRIEGKKTLGLEIAMQYGWKLPDAIIYPTGGGTGLIGMWKAFLELRDAGWVTDPMPRLFSVQSTGCAPIVKAFEAGDDAAQPWPDPWTVASGLRVPGPLGDKLMFRILRETRGGAVAVPDERMVECARIGMEVGGVDFSPEGGAALAATIELGRRGNLAPEHRVVVFNTGAGWLYREPSQLVRNP
ncbi:MAG: threonine synthase [Gemmatimonadales bacterium]